MRLVETVSDQVGAALRSASLYEQLERAYLGTAQALVAALEAKDAYTAAHARSIVGKIIDAAREQADKGLAGSMEGHAAMDMSVQGNQGFWRRLFSKPGLTSVSQYFVMDWASVIRDIVIGLLIAGAFDAWVPKAWLQALFLDGHPTLAFLIDPLIGPILAIEIHAGLQSQEGVVKMRSSRAAEHAEAVALVHAVHADDPAPANIL